MCGNTQKGVIQTVRQQGRKCVGRVWCGSVVACKTEQKADEPRLMDEEILPSVPACLLPSFFSFYRLLFILSHNARFFLLPSHEAGVQ